MSTLSLVSNDARNAMFVDSSTPLLLRPLGWCGRQWRALVHIEASSRCAKICKVILRIIPAILLSIATGFAGILGLVGCLFPKSHKTAVTYSSSVDIGKSLLGVKRLQQELSQRYQEETRQESLTYPETIRPKFLWTVFDQPQVGFSYTKGIQVSANSRQSTVSCWDRLSKAFKEEVPTVSEVLDALLLSTASLDTKAKVALWAKDVQRIVWCVDVAYLSKVPSEQTSSLRIASLSVY